MNKFIIALIAVLAVANATTFLPKEDEAMFAFTKFMKQHNKEYSSVSEFQAKFEIFRENLSHVKSVESFSPFMDISRSEFKIRHNLNTENLAMMKSQMKRAETLSTEDLPESLDWRAKGAVAHVKDQGQCGSCWAFSAVANIEGVNAIKTGKMVTLSEQQLVDCDHNGDQGCNGGLMDQAFQYLVNAGGIESDSDYKYTARDGSCKFSKAKVAVKLSGFEDISQNEEQIAAALNAHGPLSIAVNANPFQFYSGGVLEVDEESCDPQALDHGVTLVGYGSEDGKDYWIIKNSWGAGWGEEGYIRLVRGVGACGMNTNVSTAKLA
jgi:C1A family cysteine protease